MGSPMPGSRRVPLALAFHHHLQMPSHPLRGVALREEVGPVVAEEEVAVAPVKHYVQIIRQ